METTSYADIRDELQTGDVVLFDGKGPISWSIKRFTNGPWSHVGIVLVRKSRVLLWESTTLSDLPDVETGVARTGVMVVNLSARIAQYSGRCAIRRVNGPRPASRLEALQELYGKINHRPYEESTLELVRAAYDGWWGTNREDLSSIFCSELVGESFQALGFVSEKIPSNEYTPVDFSEQARGYESVQLLAPYSWGWQMAVAA